MGNFVADLAKWKQMEIVAMNILNNNWFNIIQNPVEKAMDLIIVEKGIEIKFDEYAQHSWNFYIEFECNWKPSGLYREENISLEWWGHTDWLNLYLLKGKHLKRMVWELIEKCRANKTKTHKKYRVVENWWDWWRTKGLLIPVSEMAEQAQHIYNIKQYNNGIK